MGIKKDILVGPSLRHHQVPNTNLRLLALPILIVVVVVQIYQLRHHVPPRTHVLIRYQILYVVGYMVVDLPAFHLRPP